MLQDPCYSNHSYSTNPLQTLSRRPSVRRHFLLPWKERREEGEEEKRREGKLGHVFVDPRRSSPKTCWDSSPLSVFPISMVFPCCSWWCPCVVQLGGSRRITVTLAAKQTVGNRCWDRRRRRCLCCLQGTTLGETCFCCRTCFPLVLKVFSTWEKRY